VAAYSQHDSAISRGENGAASQDADQLDSPARPRPIADKHWRQPKSFSNQLPHCQRSNRGVRGGDSALSREKSERAEEWLGKISMEIADRLIKESVEMRPQIATAQVGACAKP
jgi:hypothetical protein